MISYLKKKEKEVRYMSFYEKDLYISLQTSIP